MKTLQPEVRLVNPPGQGLGSDIIQWNESLALGIPSLDQQHRTLVELAGGLQQAMKNGSSREHMAQILKELTLYAEYHFRWEERLFAAAGYPSAADHHYKHERFRDQLQQLVERHQKGLLTAGTPVLQFLRTWISDHILSEDRQAAAYLRARRTA